MKRKKSAMKLVGILFPEAYVQGMDQLVDEGKYSSRGRAIRKSIFDLLKGELSTAKRILKERELRPNNYEL